MTANNTPKAQSFVERGAAEPTDLHRNFAAWIKRETGVDVDLKSVQLACTLRMDFQRSEDNQTELANRKQTAALKAQKAKLAKAARLEAQIAKLRAELEGNTEAETETEVKEEPHVCTMESDCPVCKGEDVTKPAPVNAISPDAERGGDSVNAIAPEGAYEAIVGKKDEDAPAEPAQDETPAEAPAKPVRRRTRKTAPKA